MSCVVAIKENNKVYLAADSACSIEGQIITTTDNKLFEHNGIIFGSVGGTKDSQIIEANIHFTDLDALYEEGPGKSGFIKHLKEIVTENRTLKHNESEDDTCDILVAYKDKMWVIYTLLFDYVTISNKSYAIGSGGNYALGALFITENQDLPIKRKLRSAIRAAAKFSDSVRLPCTFMNT